LYCFDYDQRQENYKSNRRAESRNSCATNCGAVVTNNAQDASKLVVTITEDLPLVDDERALLAKGPNVIPIAALTDEFTVKEDSEKFSRRRRLKAHFTVAAAQTQENAVSVDNSQHETESKLPLHPPPHLKRILVMSIA